MPKPDPVLSARVEQPVLIVFADLTRFMANSRSAADAALAELLDGYYRHAHGLVEAAGGRVVKFMGDAFLPVWPEAGAGDGVEALPALKRDIDAWWAAKGWDSRVVFKAHFGRAVIGPFGADARFDVIGNEVNVAATLPARTVSLSAEAFPAPRERQAACVQEAQRAGRAYPGGRSATVIRSCKVGANQKGVRWLKNGRGCTVATAAARKINVKPSRTRSARGRQSAARAAPVGRRSRRPVRMAARAGRSSSGSRRARGEPIRRPPRQRRPSRASTTGRSSVTLG